MALNGDTSIMHYALKRTLGMRPYTWLMRHKFNFGSNMTFSANKKLRIMRNVIKLRKSKIVTGNKDPVTIFMNIM